MGSTLNDLKKLLHGQEKEDGDGDVQGAQTSGQKNAQAPGLSQLSDAAEKIAVKPEDVANITATAVAQPPIPLLPSQGPSQEQLIDVAQQMQFQQPSQPDIPPPVLPESQSHLVQPGEEGKLQQLLPPMGLNLENSMLANIPMSINPLEAMSYMNYLALGTPEEATPGTGGTTRSKVKKQTRRGPMDEMRQLVRIMVKVFPHSVALIGNTEEAGGGNRISEEQIKNYIERVVGDAPRPMWGVPYGWNGYLAELFSWATGRVITGEEASRVAKREPGRSWEALESELRALGVHPSCWPLPLNLEGVQEAQRNPVPLPVPAMPTKRHTEEGGAGASGTKRSRATSERDFNKMDEADVWKVINDALSAALAKAGTGDITAVSVAKASAKAKMDELCGMALNYMSLSGLENPAAIMNLLSMAQSGLPLMGPSGQMDPNDPQTAALLAAAGIATLPMPEVPTDENTAKRMKKEGEKLLSEEDVGAASGILYSSADARQSNPFGSLGTSMDQSRADAGAKGTHTQFANLPIQPPPLNVSNFGPSINAMSIPNLNLGSLPGMSLPMGSGGAPVDEQALADGAPTADLGGPADQ